MLLDTAFLIDLTNGDDGAVEKAREIKAKLVQQRLAAMTVFELYYCIAGSEQAAAEREQAEQVLGSKPIHAADSAVMQKAERLAGELANDGIPVDDGDVIIAATAHVVE